MYRQPTVYLRSICMSEQTAYFVLHNTQRFVFITEKESVSCAVRTGCLYKTDYVSFLKGYEVEILVQCCH
jgi:hypothetical protein